MQNVDKEVFVINNKSTDHTKDIVYNYVIKYNYIHLLNCPNIGVSKARNFGLKQLVNKTDESEIIFFCDSDDFYEKNALKIVENEFNNNCDIVISSMNIVDKKIESFIKTTIVTVFIKIIVSFMILF